MVSGIFWAINCFDPNAAIHRDRGILIYKENM